MKDFVKLSKKLFYYWNKSFISTFLMLLKKKTINLTKQSFFLKSQTGTAFIVLVNELVKEKMRKDKLNILRDVV